MKALEIKKDIYWVGAIDYSSHDFHGYSLSPKGTTYNCYLISDKKNVLLDTVKSGMGGIMFSLIESVMPLDKIDYIIINHAEMDHSGAIQETINACKPEKIFCSAACKRTLAAQFDISNWPIQVVKTGDEINIGSRTISFIETRMLHWPDSMVSYVKEDKLLVSNDIFGQNIASSERFADEISKEIIYDAMSEYYHNIILPYSPRVIQLVNQLKELNLEIDMIAPDHGLIFRGKEDVKCAIDTYHKFALQKTKKKALIVFDTMWHSTETMAYAIAAGLKEAGVDSKIMNLKIHHHSAVVSELANCGLLIVGSPTHNNTILPSVSGLLTYIKGLRPKNRIAAAFGSYGWSGESISQITNELNAMDLDTPVDALRHLFVPDKECIDNCFQMGLSLAKELENLIALNK